MSDKLIIRGAREHNLRNINLELPRDKFIVITGVSGSGKSTLAFDTIYAEGQRRYVESLSAYARQFLGLMQKPDVDSIEGLSPAISIEQKTTSKNPRSTVGTVTEIYDYYRLLYARIGRPHCHLCGKEITGQGPESITHQILSSRDSEKIQVLAPIIRQKKGTYEKILENIKRDGFSRARIDQKIYEADNFEKIKLDRYVKHDIEVVVDRISVSHENKSRLQEAIELALKLSEGLVIILGGKDEKLHSSKHACVDCGVNFEELQPRMFSFNSPFGACETCHGLGFKQVFDPDLIIPDKTLCIADGAIRIHKSVMDGWRKKELANIGKVFGFSILDPIESFTDKQYEILMYGSDKLIRRWWDSSSFDTWEGLVHQIERLYKQTESDHRREFYQKFMHNLPCDACNGKKLKPKVLAVTINDKNISELTSLSIKEEHEFFKDLVLNDTEKIIAKQVLKEIRERLKFLIDVGLEYLTLGRSAQTLSGGEAQRIRLATQIGSNLMGVLYVLDEPSIGLHQRNNHKLIKTLTRLRDLGNTLLVIEHDESTIKAADWVVDIGPRAGVHGGKIVYSGPGKDITKADTLTADYINGKKKIDVPNTRREIEEHLIVKEASENNLKKLDVKIPLHAFTAITGVSGSGKSSLINETLYKALMKKIYKSKEKPGKHKELVYDEKLVQKVINVDQSPIGRTPRSNPATYIKVFDDVRRLYSLTKEAKIRGYSPGRFSFNLREGRCENCEGDGLIKIEMHFLPDVYVECEQCKSKRYNNETLEVLYKDKNIAEVLDMTVEEAVKFFDNIPSIKRKLQTLFDVGLGYIKLGQSSTTLSGGEAQRIKLTRELAKKGEGNTMYLLDEPTTGLHFDDVKKLLDVLNRLVDKKNSVVVIEHNMEVIKCCDWVIDLGLEGGDAGGYLVAQGTPEDLSKDKKSYTAEFLKAALNTS
ncbi:excinuclease ABC subunit UvrA [Candidatus Woesearchaeota archaeon]|nr:excinuclease ABC subunit UvrA [Candidatus Woesearchaeota archaeon]